MANDEVDGDDYSENILNEFAKWIDRHLYGIRYVSYGLGTLGFAILARSVRLITKFNRLVDIPERFITKHVKLQGNTERVTEDGTLYIQHTPIVATRWSKQSHGSGLPVTLTATDLLPSGISWLKSSIQCQQVWFRMMCVTEESKLSAIVTWKKKWYSRAVNVNHHLVSQGMATVKFEDKLVGDAVYENLATILNKAEIRAERKGLGTWRRPTWKERVMTYQHEMKENIAHKKQQIKKSASDWLYSKLRRKSPN